MRFGWDSFVDVVTIVWLSVFAYGYVYPEYSGITDTINLALLPVFVADLYVGYRRVGNVKVFLRRKWFDILMTIPYLRIMRVARIVRAARVVRTARTVRSMRALKGTKSTTKVARSVKSSADYSMTMLAHFQKWYKAVKKVLRIGKKVRRS